MDFLVTFLLFELLGTADCGTNSTSVVEAVCAADFEAAGIASSVEPLDAPDCGTWSSVEAVCVPDLEVVLLVEAVGPEFPQAEVYNRRNKYLLP